MSVADSTGTQTHEASFRVIGLFSCWRSPKRGMGSENNLPKLVLRAREFLRSIDPKRQSARNAQRPRFLFAMASALPFCSLLPRRRCANLDFCAVVRAERECVRAHRGMDRYFGHPDWFHLGWFSEWVPRGWAGVAQLVEHLICNQRVGGSNPFASST